MLAATSEKATFREIASAWASERRLPPKEVRQELFGSFWRGEFQQSQLDWDSDAALPKIFPRREDLFEAGEWIEIGLEKTIPKKDEFRWSIYDLFVAVGCEVSNSLLSLKNDEEVLKEIARTPLDHLSKRARIIFEHVTITKSAFYAWCDQHGFRRPRFWEDQTVEARHDISASSAEQEDNSGQPKPLSLREEGKRKTEEKYRDWLSTANDVYEDNNDWSKTEIAKEVAKKREKGENWKTILRTLNEKYPTWPHKSAQKSGEKKLNNKSE